MKKLMQIEEKLLDRIIKVAYGEGNLFDNLIIFMRSKSNQEIKKLLDEYKETSAAVNDIRSGKCPEEIIEAVTNKISFEKYKTGRLIDLLDIFIRKPLIFSAAVLIIAGMLTVYMVNKQNEKEQYSKAKVELAEKQVKESLAIVSRVFAETRNTLEKHVFQKEVSPPVKKGIEVINYLFKGG